MTDASKSDDERAMRLLDQVDRNAICIKCGKDARHGVDLWGSHYKFEGRMCNRCWDAIPRMMASCRSSQPIHVSR